MTSKRSKRKVKMTEYLPWVEKYRPKQMKEIAHQSHVITILQKALTTNNANNLPHLLFYGPPGTGKTSTILALCRELFGPQLMKDRVLELNASDERGINVVRSKIKTFAQYTVSSAASTSLNSDGQPRGLPCFKIIILDEADCMTRDAQTALRRTMERYSNVTRFCLICNYVSRIIAPVASRCAKFRFQPLSKASMLVKLREIVRCEGILVAGNGDVGVDDSDGHNGDNNGDGADTDVIDAVIELSNGDMRKSITLLQSASMMKSKGEVITIVDVETVCVRIPNSLIIKIITSCQGNPGLGGGQNNNHNRSNNTTAFTAQFDPIANVCEFIMAEGYPVSLIFPKLLDYVIECPQISNLGKAEIALNIAQSDKKLVDGASEFLQLMSILSVVSKHVKNVTNVTYNMKKAKSRNVGCADDIKESEDNSNDMIDID